MSQHRYIYREPSSRQVSEDPNKLPTHLPIAVYYRQSTDGQVGNVSTAMQTIDLPEHIAHLGWAREHIFLIDDDAGISGTTAIDERPGMSKLYDLITEGKIGAVACQDEDRLFRDQTQIQPNIFMDACKRAKVIIITPTFTYNFHGEMGAFHARQFRFKSEMGAEFISSYIQRRLIPARERLSKQGIWVGGNVTIGYMLDPENRFVPFPLCIEVIQDYFQLFIGKGGNLRATEFHIRKHGPYYPDFDAPEVQALVPEKHRLLKPYGLKRTADGHYMPTYESLKNMFTNATYLGHWMIKGQIVRWNNHPAIVPEDLFLKAFNYLSARTLDGKPNPYFTPRITRNHAPLDERRKVPRPLLEGKIVSCDDGGRWRVASITWEHRSAHYAYQLKGNKPESKLFWYRRTDLLDAEISALLVEKLKDTFSSSVWETVVASFGNVYHKERKRILSQLASLEREKAQLASNLAHITLPAFLAEAEKQYAAYEAECSRLKTKLEQTENETRQKEALHKIKEMCGPALEHWDDMPQDDKRLVANAFIDKVVVTAVDAELQVTVYWQDRTVSELLLAASGENFIRWLKRDFERLFELVDSNASQIEIAAAFPTRPWKMIRQKLWLKRGVWLKPSPKPILDYETYVDYCARVAECPQPHVAGTGDRWNAQQTQTLTELLDTNATQYEIASYFPWRKWDAIRRKIKSLRGNVYQVAGMGEISYLESFDMYKLRTQQAALVSSDNEVWSKA